MKMKAKSVNQRARKLVIKRARGMAVRTGLRAGETMGQPVKDW
jgi:hypothetical protein